MNVPIDPSSPTRALADFAFGTHTQVADASRPLAWLSPEELEIDLTDPVARRFGDYELIEKVGQGGMGVVYRARQHGLERDVALKLLAAGPWASDEFVARFRREAKSAARMQHPNIVEIFEFGHRDGLNYFSMRLIEGQSLAQKLHVAGPLQPKDAAALLRTLAEAMDYAHRLGVLHLDLKPANVLLTEAGTPLIADFGLARRIDAGHEGGSGEISGTPSYMAPEQALLESHPLSASTDIYGLGAVLYECLVGRAPFIGADAQKVLERVVTESPVAPRTLRRDVPADLEAICLKCLGKSPAQRYATARELADDLGRFLEARPVSVRPLGPMQRAQRWARREPRVATALAVALFALVAGAATSTWQWRHAIAERKAAEQSEAVASAERDRAKIASEIGAYLFAHASDAEDDEGRARGLIAWLQQRWPGDEVRQADALTAFAASVSSQQDQGADQLLSAIIKVIGADYRRQVIASLQAGNHRYRHLYSAMLAWNDTDGGKVSPQFESSLRAAMAAHPEDPFALQVAAVYCPSDDVQRRCLFPEAAAQLVRVAPDNAYHWLLLALETRDDARKREALHEAASRTHFEDYLGANYLAYAKAIDAAKVPVPALIKRPVAALAPGGHPEVLIALTEANAIPIAGWTPLVRYCVPADIAALDPQVRADCLAVGERMARSHDALVTQMIGVAIVRNLAVGTPLAEEMKQIRAHYQYLGAKTGTLSERQLYSYPAGRYLQEMATLGELATMQRRVEFFGMPGTPPAGWQPENPDDLLSARERMDKLVAVNDKAAQLVQRGQYADAVALLLPAEKSVRDYLGTRQAWQVPRFLVTLGKARTGLREFAAAERDLLEAWELVQPLAPTSDETRDCAQALASLYAGMEAAEPGRGFADRAAEWRVTLAGLPAPRTASTRK